MDEKKKDQQISGKEVNGACGLLAAQDSHEHGENRNDGGRHGEARPDHQGKQKEDPSQVGEPLNEVVGERGFYNGPRKGTSREIGLLRQEVLAEVLRQDAGECVKRAVNYAKPGGEKVQVTAPSGWTSLHERQRQVEERGSSTPPVSPQQKRG